MNDWKAKLEGLSKKLEAEERSESERKAALLSAFRQRLLELEPIVKAAIEFGDAFGVDAVYEVNRFHDRFPYLRFRLLRPVLEYEVTCRDGILREQLREGLGKAKVREVSLESLAPKEFEARVTQWVQAAANANRKVPGKRK